MARVSVDDLARRMEAKTKPQELPQAASAPVALPPLEKLSRKEQLSRQGLSFTGYYINQTAKKQLRELAFRTERDKQDLFREAMNLLFERYDMDPVTYAKD